MFILDYFLEQALECKLKGVKDVSSPGADITGQVDSMFLTAGDFTAVFYPPDSGLLI